MEDLRKVFEKFYTPDQLFQARTEEDVDGQYQQDGAQADLKPGRAKDGDLSDDEDRGMHDKTNLFYFLFFLYILFFFFFFFY